MQQTQYFANSIYRFLAAENAPPVVEFGYDFLPLPTSVAWGKMGVGEKHDFGYELINKLINKYDCVVKCCLLLRTEICSA